MRCTSLARLTRFQITPTMIRLSGSAKPTTSRIRRAEMLKWLRAALNCRPARDFADQALPTAGGSQFARKCRDAGASKKMPLTLYPDRRPLAT